MSDSKSGIETGNNRALRTAEAHIIGAAFRDIPTVVGDAEVVGCAIP